MLLYHYCKLEKFKSIIESKTLWLTQIVKSNDKEEVSRTFKIIWNSIKKDLEKGLSDIENSADIVNIICSQMEVDLHSSLKGEETPYGVCLSINRDLAQNWNEYGDMSRGIAIGFSSELFTGITHAMPHPNVNLEHSIGWNEVYYDRDGLSQKFIPIFIDTLTSNSTALGWLVVRTTLKHYSAFIKNPTFKDEREVRVIYYPHKEHVKNSISEVSNIIEKPFLHCTLPWLKSDGMCALKEIIIGTNCEYTSEDVKNLLHKNGLHKDISIVNSEYPYTISENR